MGNFNFNETGIKDLYVVEPAIFLDERGFFMETYNKNDFHAAGLKMDFVQDNHSRSSHGVLRGLHFQVNRPQGKLVRVLSGDVFDVAVDLRRESKTYGKWFGIHLSGENKKQFYVPEGFAHGFLVTSEFADFAYKCTNFYDPKDENGIIWDDETLGIKWPLDRVANVLVSEKDKKLKGFIAD